MRSESQPREAKEINYNQGERGRKEENARVSRTFETILHPHL
jgi:hypothetical protein